MDYEEQMHDLKQEIYSLQARLQEEQENADNRRKVASGGDLKVNLFINATKGRYSALLFNSIFPLFIHCLLQ